MKKKKFLIVYYANVEDLPSSDVINYCVDISETLRAKWIKTFFENHEYEILVIPVRHQKTELILHPVEIDG